MARGQRDRSKEQHWRQHVAAWRRSGQSVRAYCRAAGLAEPSFYSWRRVLAERATGGAAPTERGATRTAVPRARRGGAVSPFVPVRLVAEAPPAAALEVVVRGGRVVRVPAGFAASTLRAVVAALEELPC
jgi:transposase-like protein